MTRKKNVSKKKKEINFATEVTKVHMFLVATIKEKKKNSGNNNKKDISIVEVQ